MKFIFISLILALSVTFTGAMSACTDENDSQVETPAGPDPPVIPGGSGNETNSPMNIRIKIGEAIFTATLSENATASAFRALLPMTINMQELNRNEKYYNLSGNLPVAATRPGTIRTGDLMLYGSNCLVLFYKSFSSSYSYTPIGRIDDPSGLETTVGTGNVTVTFEEDK